MFRAANYPQMLAKRAEALRNRLNAEEKCNLARDMGASLDQPNLRDVERMLAEEIIQKLVEDEVIAVRAAIAEAVAGSPHLPGQIAKKLAADISEVAIPVLELSPVLEEKVLEDVINSGIPDKINAIAGRDFVSENLCRRIVASGRKGAVVRLLNNPGADITDHTMVTIVRVYGDDSHVEEAVIARGDLPESVIESLQKLTEAHVGAFIQRYFNLPEHMVDIEKGRQLLERKEDRRDNSSWWDSHRGAV